MTGRDGLGRGISEEDKVNIRAGALARAMLRFSYGDYIGIMAWDCASEAERTECIAIARRLLPVLDKFVEDCQEIGA